MICKKCYSTHPKVMVCDACKKALVCQSHGVVADTFYFPIKIFNSPFGFQFMWSGNTLFECRFMNLFFCYTCFMERHSG